MRKNTEGEQSPMRITALTENTARRADITAEHGLSLYIETAKKRVLFDMGQSDLFLRNAAVLGIDLSRVDAAVISHGHYDHGGGLAAFLQINDHAPVYVSRYAFEEHRNQTGKDIGLSPALCTHPRLIFTDDLCDMAEGWTLCSCNGYPRNYPSHSGDMTAMGQTEDFRHEQYLLIKVEGKKVLVSGCSHKGILNVAAWFRPDVLIGGFHLSSLPCGEELADVARQLAAYDTDYITCHCTGTEQYERMRRDLPRLRYLSAGETIEI